MPEFFFGNRYFAGILIIESPEILVQRIVAAKWRMQYKRSGMTIILRDNLADMNTAAIALRAGHLVAIPTETVYGLAADAFSDLAVAKVFAAKERPSFDPLIVHVRAADANLATLSDLGVVRDEHLTNAARSTTERLIKAFWPGSLTLLLPRGPSVPDLVTAGSAWVGVRVPSHPMAQKILHHFGAPLAAPSANRFGRISPTRASDVISELGDRVGFVLDGGPCRVGVESTVARVLSGGEVEVLRPGAVSIEALQQVTGRSVRIVNKGSGTIESPGQLDSHYAPRKPVWQLDAGVAIACAASAVSSNIAVIWSAAEHEAALLPRLQRQGLTIVRSEVLGESTGDGQDAARRLFGVLRDFDSDPAVQAIVVTLPTVRQGLWLAVHDRLLRASAG